MNRRQYLKRQLRAAEAELGPKQQAALKAVSTLLRLIDDTFDLEYPGEEWWAEAIQHVVGLERIISNHGHELDDPPYKHLPEKHYNRYL